MKKYTMNFVGFSEYDYPAYEDQDKKIWLDINYGNANGIIDLYSSINGLEGEPVKSFISSHPDAKIEFLKKFKKDVRELDYMLLSKYQQDCEYFLGYGNGYEGHLSFQSIPKQIEEMKTLYNSFPDESKPVWISMQEIEEYDQKMQEKLKERLSKKSDQ